ncbi:MTHFR-domain-containing protein [Dimargaris cristalligena]|uniref:MTHFR-domain-containing protein n=1 Tax=Dimargaris cristalligena TaxID=215637 RepID=A0A4Q0A2D9_9FUNG|nr:MTHFR-domain-containing protein [Dimargaris cristalligena]|eukprot:RKP40273.1 MTHFR-domain-containing protein [Dimargaris cristalligena]
MKQAPQTGGSEFAFSFEFFPPKTDQGLANLSARVTRMASLRPTFVGVTWGAGGSTAERSLELCQLIQDIQGVDVLMHLTCTNMDRTALDQALAAAKTIGIRNILALRGDAPRSTIPTQEDGSASSADLVGPLVHAVDLVKYIRQTYGDYFCIGVAAYPEGHPDASMTLANASPLSHSFGDGATVSPSEVELQYLKEKVDAGADFIITQMFFDAQRFIDWYRASRSKDISVPIIPNILPIQQYQSFRRIAQLCQVHVPASVLSDLAPIQLDDSAVKAYGEQLALNLIRTLHRELRLDHFHMTTLNLESSVSRIIAELRGVTPTGLNGPTNRVISASRARALVTSDARIQLVTGEGRPAASNDSALVGEMINMPVSSRNQGKDSVGIVTTWDEFPNGRWGDSSSPAYGEYSAYGGSVLPITGRQATSWWGRPTQLADLTSLFARFMQGPPEPSAAATAHTSAIQRGLLQLITERSILTIASQPPVDGQPSADPAVGWGPPGGLVYQKPFVEFFISATDYRTLQQTQFQNDPWITFLAGNKRGEFESSGDDGNANMANAVTWGIFPGREVVQASMVDRDGFLAWKDEAFQIWDEWAKLSPPGSATERFLRATSEDIWLVNVVYNDFRAPISRMFESVFGLQLA